MYSGIIGPRILEVSAVCEQQSNWRWCRKCQAQFWGGAGGGVCTAGGKHDGGGSADYSIPFDFT